MGRRKEKKGNSIFAFHPPKFARKQTLFLSLRTEKNREIAEKSILSLKKQEENSPLS